jgi:hypothetical protein
VISVTLFKEGNQMPKFNLSIEADSLEELISCLAVNRSVAPPLSELVEEDPAVPLPEKSRQTRRRAPSSDASSATTKPEEASSLSDISAGSTNETAEHQLLKEYTQQDVLDAGSECLRRNPTASDAILKTLEKDFAVKAFKKIDPADYGRAIAMLNDFGK